MANLFDVTNAREGEPEEIVVGDFVQWKRSDLVADYPLGGAYIVEYVARVTGGGATEIKVLAQEAGGTYLFSVESTDTAAFSPGRYHWQLEVTQVSTDNRVVVDTGDFVAVADLDLATSDPRTHAEKMLALVEQALEAKLGNGDVIEYTINGRSLKKMTYEQLLDLRDRYRAEVKAHQDAMKAKKGKPTSSQIRVRFV